MTIVLSIQYIGMDTQNSKSVIKNNNKTAFFIIKSAQFVRITGIY